MIYKILFYCLICFFIGRKSVGFKLYIGNDPKKYEAATMGVLLTK